MMSALASHMLALPPVVALLVVFALPALESSAFIGFIFPGEIALILGGVLAYEGNVSLGAVLAAGTAGAIVGDSVGYAVGRRYGRRMLDGTVGRFVKSRHLDRAEKYLAERGGRAVFFGRFTAALRVMIPGLAGMSGLRYRTFVTYNVASGLAWGTMSVLLGYLGGSSWRHVEHIASRIGLAALAVVVALLGGVLLRRTRAGRFTRLATRITSSPAVRGTRERFPRTTSWIGARIDPANRTGLALTVALTVAVAATWTFLGITQDVLAREEFALLDPRIHGWVLAHRIPSLDTFFKTVTWLGATTVTVPLLAIGGGLLARRRRSWAPVLDITAVYGTALLLHAVVGQLVHRNRPTANDWIASADGWAYPSGHTTQAVAAWGILAVIVSAGASPRGRVLAGSGAASVAVLVAVSRVYLGVPWTTDVLGAAAMSTAVVATWTVARRSLITPAGTTRRPPPSPPSFVASTGDPHPPRSHIMTPLDASAAFDSRRTVVIIPTYNEAGNITTIIDRLRAAAPAVDVLVVDDNSPDGTASIVMHHRGYLADHSGRREGPGRVFLLSRAEKDGLGAAYRAGFTWALALDYEAVVQMDADLSHPAERVPALLGALGQADVTVGSRYVPGGAVSNWSLSRRLISRSGNLYVRLVLGLPVHDTTAGFKAFRRDALERLGAVESASNGYCFQIEITWRAVRLGLRVTEVPITFTDRPAGTSKMTGSIVAEALSRVLVWRWNELLHRYGKGSRHHAGGCDTPGTTATPQLGAHDKSVGHHAAA